jgi:pullulanase
MKTLELNEKILNESYGVKLDGEHTVFKVWSPSSKDVKVCIYDYHNDVRRKTKKMIKDVDGIWSYKSNRNLEGKYYTYLLDDTYEVIDPYVQSTNANSSKGMIIDASKVNPNGFLNHTIPEPLKATESILYELHIKDFSMDDNADFSYKGKYLSFTEKGLLCNGEKIGIDHLIELGITHVHLLPIYDFITVNDYNRNDYNWGYDPYLYNSLEGSYATNPEDGSVRIYEFKEMIMALHEAGIRIVLDVVYNHTYFSKTSNFNRLMPNLFYRFDEENNFTNGSGCGCELDTENLFVRKFIVNSLKFWLETYKIDGFRFDLMALYDIDTMKVIEKELKEIRPDILLYGEPWVGGPSSLSYEKRFIKGKQNGGEIALFNDEFRNAIRGNNDTEESGFIGSEHFKKNDVYAGCFGSISFSNNIIGFTSSASETVNYVSSHDNLILMDKFSKSFRHASFEEKQNMNALALSMIILSFGIPFIQAGTEFLRSKYGNHNSYNASNYINIIDWSYKKNNRQIFDYVKILIEFRKSQKVFSISDQQDIKKVVKIKESDEHIIIYELNSPFKEDYNKILIVYNGSNNNKVIKLDRDDYSIKIDGAFYCREKINLEKDILMIPKLSTAICIKQ